MCTVKQVDSNKVDTNQEATRTVKQKDPNNNSDLSLLLECEQKNVENNLKPKAI